MLHNQKYSATQSWSYGPEYEKGVCATGSKKTPGCNGGSWTGCGSNTYPTGDFPACKSSLDVYDLNGNAAEHMNLPIKESQMSSLGSTESRLHGDERQLVRLRYHSGSSGLVPLARSILARDPRDG